MATTYEVPVFTSQRVDGMPEQSNAILLGAAVKTSDQNAITNNTWTKCAWDAAIVNPFNLVDLTNDRIYTPWSGNHYIAASYRLANSADTTTNKAACFYVNGTVYDPVDDGLNDGITLGNDMNNTHFSAMCGRIDLTAGDYVELFCIINSGGTNDIEAELQGTDSFFSQIWLIYLGPATTDLGLS